MHTGRVIYALRIFLWPRLIHKNESHFPLFKEENAKIWCGMFPAKLFCYLKPEYFLFLNFKTELSSTCLLVPWIWVRWVHVSVFVCICLCVYVCECMFVCLCLRVGVCVSGSMRSCVNLQVFVSMCECVSETVWAGGCGTWVYFGRLVGVLGCCKWVWKSYIQTISSCSVVCLCK